MSQTAQTAKEDALAKSRLIQKMKGQIAEALDMLEDRDRTVRLDGQVLLEQIAERIGVTTDQLRRYYMIIASADHTQSRPTQPRNPEVKLGPPPTSEPKTVLKWTDLEPDTPVQTHQPVRPPQDQPASRQNTPKTQSNRFTDWGWWVVLAAGIVGLIIGAAFASRWAAPLAKAVLQAEGGGFVTFFHVVFVILLVVVWTLVLWAIARAIVQAIKYSLAGAGNER